MITQTINTNLNMNLIVVAFKLNETNYSKTLIGNYTLYQYVAAGSQLLSATFFYIILTKVFPTTEVGAIALFVAIIGILNMIFSLGMGVAARHFTSFYVGRGEPHVVRNIILKISFISILLSFCGFLFLYMISSALSITLFHNAHYVFFMQILSINLALYISYGILNGLILGLQKFKIASLINAITWFSYYFGGLIFAIFFNDISVVIAGWIIGVSIGITMELIILFKTVSISHPISEGNLPIGQLARYSLPILFSSVIGYGASYADRFIVAGYLNLSSVAIYNLAILIATSIGFVAVPFNNILLSKYSEWIGRDRQSLIKRTFGFTSLVLSAVYVPSALGIISLSGVLIKAIAGYQYAAGETSLNIIIGVTALFITQNIMIQAIAAVKLTRVFVYSGLISLTTNIVLSILLIPKIGITGAAIGYGSVYASVFITLYWFSKKFDLLDINFKGITKIWVASFAIVVFVRPLVILTGSHTILFPLYILIGIAIYIISIRVLRVFSPQEIELISLFFKEKNWFIKRFLSIISP